MDTRRYFDYAATSFPKPPGVADAVRDYLVNCGASAGRGAYAEARRSGALLDRCRDAVRALLGCTQQHLVIFTLNGTDALNMGIKGLLRRGDHALTTAMDHNSVLRPLNRLRDNGVEHTIVPVDPHTTRIDPAEFRAALRPNTKLAAINHASNVTGVLQPIDDLAEICRSAGVLLIVDGAQSAGHVPVDLERSGIDLFATPGHKGLLGPLGTGVLVVRDEVAAQMVTWREGGTGSASESALQPTTGTDKFESGSHNAAGLAGLLAALTWIAERGVGAIRAHEAELMSQMIDRLEAIEGLTWYGPRTTEDRVGVFSVRCDGLAAQELAAVLEDQFGVLSRAGLHCAPHAHEAIGTLEVGGTTRLSTGVFTTAEDVEAATAALAEISADLTLTSA